MSGPCQPSQPHMHSIHPRRPSDDPFAVPFAAPSLAPSPRGSSARTDSDAGHPLAAAADMSPRASPTAPQPRSHFASVSTESGPSGPAAGTQYLSARSAAHGAYRIDGDDMSQYLSFQDFDGQAHGAAHSASPPSTAPPSFQGSPASWPPDLDSGSQQLQMFSVFSDLHHPHQHDFPLDANISSSGGLSPVGLDLMTGMSDFGFGGPEGEYFLPPWNPSGGNLFHMQPPSSPYELGLGDDVDACKDSAIAQQRMQQFMADTPLPPMQGHSPLQFPFSQAARSPSFLPATPPRQRLPFPIQANDGQSPSPGIAPSELELPSGPPPSLTPSPTFSPTSAPTTAPPRWVQAFDVPRSQALDIHQHPPTSPSFSPSPNDMGFIPPPPFATAPAPMPLPFSQTRHRDGYRKQSFGSSRAHGGHPASPLSLAQIFQPASAPPHSGGNIHAHRSARMRTYSQRAGSALRDALRAEAFASGNASRSQPRSPVTGSNSNDNSTALDFDDGRGSGGVGALGLGSGMMDVDEGTVRGSAYGFGFDATTARSTADADATVRKKKRPSARLTTPSPRVRMRSLPRDETPPGSEGSVERDRDVMPVRSELRPPKLAPSTWQLYFTDWIQRHQSMHGGDRKLNVAQAAKEAGAEYANLTPEQKEPFKRRSQAAKEERERELAAWQRTLTPEDIKRENAFRAAQRKAGKSRKGNIKDPNAPKKPLSAYFMFLQHIRSDAALVQEVFGDERETTNQSVLAAFKWRSMTDEERKPFLAQAEKEKLEYEAARRMYEDGSVGFESTISFNIPEASGSGREGTTTFVISTPAAEHASASDYEPDSEGSITDEERHEREHPFRA